MRRGFIHPHRRKGNRMKAPDHTGKALTVVLILALCFAFGGERAYSIAAWVGIPILLGLVFDQFILPRMKGGRQRR